MGLPADTDPSFADYAHPERLVSTTWLAEHLGQPGLAVVESNEDVLLYSTGHIPGAVHLDLGRDLSGPAGRHGGRHPLPDPEVLAETFGRAGIGPGTRVVAYDADGGMFAARVWWLLRWLGFADVQVLDGGFAAWQAAGFPVSTDPVRPVPAPDGPGPC